ncbi:MAG: hypothetical protein OSB00_04760 [Sphingomonas bacterium]|nr:hypothetical protein [Sphingomonas bacterium]
MRKFGPLLPIVALCLSGCVAKTAWDVATLPVKATGKVIDWTTTSQEESDRNYGRKMRKQEAEEGRARKEAAKECRKHPENKDACEYRGYRAGYNG